MDRIQPIRQARAGRTAEALAAAASTLMREGKRLAEVPVSEIARRAGVSVGAFYSRFTCKEALLDWLCQHHLREEGEAIAGELRARERRGAPVAELVTLYVGRAAAFYEQHSDLLREIVHLAYGPGDPSALRQTIEVSGALDRAVVEVLLARREQLGCEDPETTVPAVPVLVAAMLRTYVLLRPWLEGRPRRLSRAQRREIERWVSCALGLARS